jgi:hypothetical protein
MLKDILTIEDCIEVISGFRNDVVMEAISTDYTIMSSIARQVSRGLALTDKQYEVCRSKLITNYKPQFDNIGCDIERVTENLRQPLRVIDRSKYIRLITEQEKVQMDNLAKENKDILWFVVRFPFSKKLIVDLESCIVDRKNYFHPKGSHSHYFLVNETNVFEVVDAFKEKEFNIDSELIEFYNRILIIKNNPKDYIPCIVENNAYNISDKVHATANKELGPLTNDSLLLYIDRANRYGITKIDHNLKPNTVIEKIALRPTAQYLSSPLEEDTISLISAVHSLDRYPLLVIIQEPHAETQLHELFNIFRNIVDPKEQSVLFRLSSDTGQSFNQYIKENNLNNWVDNNTKIVYISNTKLPKLLVTGSWKPITALAFDSYPLKFIDAYIQSNCDLIVYRDDRMSPFKKYFNAKL